MRTYVFKMRAEYVADVEQFWRSSPIMAMHIKAGWPADSGLRGDVTVTFTTTLTLNKVLKILRRIPSGHIMVRTLNFAAKYDEDYARLK